MGLRTEGNTHGWDIDTHGEDIHWEGTYTRRRHTQRGHIHTGEIYTSRGNTHGGDTRASSQYKAWEEYMSHNFGLYQCEATKFSILIRITQLVVRQFFPADPLPSRCRFDTGLTSYRDRKATGLAPTDTGLAKTIGIAPQARICFPGPGPGTACHPFASSTTTTGRPIAFVEKRQHLEIGSRSVRCGSSTLGRRKPIRTEYILTLVSTHCGIYLGATCEDLALG